jgi:hypothetical protein
MPQTVSRREAIYMLRSCAHRPGVQQDLVQSPSIRQPDLYIHISLFSNPNPKSPHTERLGTSLSVHHQHMCGYSVSGSLYVELTTDPNNKRHSHHWNTAAEHRMAFHCLHHNQGLMYGTLHPCSQGRSSTISSAVHFARKWQVDYTHTSCSGMIVSSHLARRSRYIRRRRTMHRVARRR